MISVIIPVYNGEKWIDQCVCALQNQTIIDQLEIIFVDDGSTDLTSAILDKYATESSILSVIHIENNGVSNARNIGMDAATGEYLAFLDVDDWIEPDYYEILAENIDDDCDIVCGGYIVEYTTKSVLCKSPYAMYYDKPDCVKAYLINKNLDPNIWNKLFRRTSIHDIRFHTDLVQAEDRYFFFQCLKKVRRIKIIPEAKYHYSINDTSAIQGAFSKRKLDSCIVADYICKETVEEYPEYKELAECYAIDIKARIIGEMYYKKAHKQYSDAYKIFYRQIRAFSLRKKIKYSDLKHIIAFLTMKIHPKFYVLLKYGLKLQYK